MKTYSFPLLAVTFLIQLCTSCKKETGDTGGAGPGGGDTSAHADTSGTLRDAASFPVGAAIGYEVMKNNARFAAIVKSEFDNVTFDYHMKHGAIVQNDGRLDFTTADALFNLAAGAGLQVYGHTLAWHENNNGTYLRSLLAGPLTATGPNLIQNGNFEGGSGDGFTNWFTQVAGSANGVITSDTADAYEGSRSVKVAVTTPGAQAYDVQLINDAWAAQSGKAYRISFYAKGTGARLRVVSQGNTYYQQHDLAPAAAWTKYEWDVSPTEGAPQVKFHFPERGTFFIDQITVHELAAGPAAPGTAVQARIDSALQTFITGMVTHYKGKVAAWDVVNEALADGTSGLRTNPTPGATTGDRFYWSEHLGRNYIANAFQYAHAADPAALLFINDYNLEWNGAKLDSFVALAGSLKAQNMPIHGVGTQMHMNINTARGDIDRMFKKLAATGLKVKVTELDIRINPGDQPSFTATEDLLKKQADMYRYVVESYLQHVPAAQRYGITVWGVGDADSWINTVLQKKDFPLLYDRNYAKKPAFYGFLEGLKKS